MTATPHISLKDVVVEIPIYGAPQHHSIKQKAIFLGTGGRLARDAGSIPKVIALDGVSFDIEAGNRVGLLGHNGAGKTTLLRVLAGILKPKSGTVDVAGKTSVFINPSIGMNPESTGREFIYLQSMINNVPSKCIAEKIDEIIEFTELGDFIDLPMRTYSAGMQTRLSFAVATAYDADIVLIDEGLGAGDEKFQVKAVKRFDEWLGRAGIVVVASHSQELINRICNRTIQFSQGKIISQ